jgi:hypothetical protein|tara:strand:+ start:177 stop:548 length:372 start_codon:yes stop_codon:yes gene_type:complete
MKICIIGSRSLDKAEVIFPIIDKFISSYTGQPITFLIGNAKGVDPLSKKFAEARGIDIVEFIPYHLIDPTAKFNSKYFFVRTKQMINNADRVLAIWNTQSKGTEYGIKYSQKKEIPVSVVKVP